MVPVISTSIDHGNYIRLARRQVHKEIKRIVPLSSMISASTVGGSGSGNGVVEVNGASMIRTTVPLGRDYFRYRSTDDSCFLTPRLLVRVCGNADGMAHKTVQSH